MSAAAKSMQWGAFRDQSGRLSVCPFVNSYFVWCDISILSGGISV